MPDDATIRALLDKMPDYDNNWATARKDKWWDIYLRLCELTLGKKEDTDDDDR